MVRILITLGITSYHQNVFDEQVKCLKSYRRMHTNACEENQTNRKNEHR